MTLGLKRKHVTIIDHDPEWEDNAAWTIERLWHILGPIAVDIQHVGSSAICHIKAKPVIDLAVLVDAFDDVLALSPVLEKEGFIFRGWEGQTDRQPVYQCGIYDPDEKEMTLLTHYIHIVRLGSPQWQHYINFRDYMNAFPDVAQEYEALKVKLAESHRTDYPNYHQGKQAFITEVLKHASQWNALGRKPESYFDPKSV